MVLGFLLISMLAGAVASGLMLIGSWPLWLVPLAYSLAGSATLLLYAFARVGFSGHPQPDTP